VHVFASGTGAGCCVQLFTDISITLLAITVPLAPFCGWVIQNKTFKQSAQSHGRLNCCSENSTA